FSEPKLIKLASGFEAATQVRAHNLPTFAPTVPFNHIAGTTLKAESQRLAAPAQKGSQSAPTEPDQTAMPRTLPHHLQMHRGRFYLTSPAQPRRQHRDLKAKKSCRATDSSN